MEDCYTFGRCKMQPINQGDYNFIAVDESLIVVNESVFVAHECLTGMRWGEGPLESSVGLTFVDPCPAGAAALARLQWRARAATPAGHGSTNVGPTVDSYGPPFTSF